MFQLPGIISAMLSIPVINQSALMFSVSLATVVNELLNFYKMALIDSL